MKLVASGPSQKQAEVAPLSVCPIGDGSLAAGIWRFWVPGPMPGLNDIIEARMIRRGQWNKYTDMKHQWTGLVAMLAKRARLPFMDSAHVSFVHYEPNMRRDPDNFTGGAQKFVLDGLTGSVLPKDGWGQVQSLQHRWFCDKTNPGVSVFLSDKELETKALFLLDRQCQKGSMSNGSSEK